MGSLWRSEEMSLVQVFLPQESAQTMSVAAPFICICCNVVD